MENQNKTTSTQHHTDCASGLRSHFSLQSARSRAAAARPGRQAAPRRAPLHTCLGRGPSLGVYLLQRSPTQRHSCCGAPLNPTTSRPASAAPLAVGEPEAATLGTQVTTRASSKQPEVGLRLPSPMTPRARRGGEDGAGPGVGAGPGREK